MSRVIGLLAVGMLLGVGSIGAGAAPRSEWVIGRPATADLNLAQYDDGGRCFNRCVSGRIFHSCQTAPEGKTQNCCSEACNRANNEDY
jgi:hypothetical protein